MSIALLQILQKLQFCRWLSTSLGEQTGDGLMQCRQTLSDSVWYLAYIYGICIFMSIIVTIGGCMYHSCCRGWQPILLPSWEDLLWNTMLHRAPDSILHSNGLNFTHGRTVFASKQLFFQGHFLFVSQWRYADSSSFIVIFC